MNLWKRLKRRWFGKQCPYCGEKFFNRGPHMKRCKKLTEPCEMDTDHADHAEDGDCPIIPGVESIKHLAEEVAKGVDGDEGDLMPPPQS